MKRLNHILLEGRVEDAQQYFEKAVGSWPVAEVGNPAGIGGNTNIEGVLQYFVENDPSDNNKYLMWMVKMYLNPEEKGTSPHDISSLVQRFHKNVDRVTPELIDDLNWGPGLYNKAPKDINSYRYIASLERLMDEVEERQTKKQKEEAAKTGAEKIYEDGRWLVVKPNTLEASCYYGAGTKWCTTTKDTQHFKDYSSKGPLYYIIDKSRQLGRFYKIAMHVTWDGEEEYYDEQDNRLEDNVLDAIKALLPHRLQQTIFDNWEDTGEPEKETMSLEDFKYLLEDYADTHAKQQTIKTESGVWKLSIDDGVWSWINSINPRIEVQATPFFEGRMEIPFDSYEIGPPMTEPWGTTLGAEYLETDYYKPESYLDKNPQRFQTVEGNVRGFLTHIYRPLVISQLSSEEVQAAVGETYKTWDATSWVSSYAFKYPPKQGTMTQMFTDYLKENPRRTSNQFYEDVLGRSRPRGHNNMFFASIKDAGIVKLERKGRQFVYSLGPNYDTWTQGKLLRTGGRHS